MDLTLNLKSIYFDQIKSGEKKEEYRLYNEYWIKRLQNKNFDKVIVCMGYPKKDDLKRRLTFSWSGYEIKTISHPHFGTEPVKVFAIKLI